jgi:hypothetical protein
MSSDVPTPMTAAVEKDCRPLHWIELIALRSNLRPTPKKSSKVSARKVLGRSRKRRTAATEWAGSRSGMSRPRQEPA